MSEAAKHHLTNHHDAGCRCTFIITGQNSRKKVPTNRRKRKNPFTEATMSGLESDYEAVSDLFCGGINKDALFRLVTDTSHCHKSSSLVF